VKRLLLPLALLVAFALAVAAPAGAIERNFAGSAQLDYHLVPSQPNVLARRSAFDGMTLEAAVKVAVDVSDHISANVKVCFGCHGFEANMAYVDLRLFDELNLRVGRFSPSFGNFNLRHDPGNHRLSDKPLVYDMGRRLRMRSWNMSVLPSPFPDNGLELNGTHWFGEKLQLDYAAYMVTGFKGPKDAFDIDWIQSRSGQLYYVDNNGRPAGGARAALTWRIADDVDATLGASGMYGTFDPDNRLSYLILGSDLTFRIHRTNVRFEWLARRQEFDVTDPARFQYAVAPSGGNFYVKQGAYAEVEQPLSQSVDLIGRFDVLGRNGNVLRDMPEQARTSTVLRYTLGTSIVVERGFRVKGSTELWQWSDRDAANGNKLDVSFHLAAVGTF